MAPIEANDKLYVVVRKDLTPGQMMAQSLHVAFAFARQHRHLTDQWIDISNYICALEIDNEHHLLGLLRRAEEKGIVHSIFREDDMDNALTAIALAPGTASKELCRGLKLALKDILSITTSTRLAVSLPERS
jgi:peptidyl-tRNA hydrolase